MTKEASITAPRAPDLKLEAPTSIEGPEATMKLIQATTAALHAPREVGATTATRRSGMNPLGLNHELSMRGRGITRLVDRDDVHGLTTTFQAAP